MEDETKDKKTAGEKQEKDLRAAAASTEAKAEAKQAEKKKSKKGKAEAKPAKVKKQRPERKLILDKNVDPFETIQFVLMTEKCVRMIEAQNKLVFVVRRNSDKKAVKKAVENAFQSAVAGITTMIDQDGRKRAFVKFDKAGVAGEIAIRLGII